MTELVRVGAADKLRKAGMTVVSVGRTPVVVLWHQGRFHALDNRCPHLGFPLSKGDVRDGLLACHWHHARFDVTCGATLDPWADDVDGYTVTERDGEVFVDPTRPPRDPREHGLGRLTRGLGDNLPLVTAKAVVELGEGGVDPVHAVTRGAVFAAKEQASGWQAGLTILTGMWNVLPSLHEEDRQRALTHALRWIAAEVNGKAPRRPLPGLSGSARSAEGLRTWFRETVEVRDADGAERILLTLVERHGPRPALDAVLAACTDHRYCEVGHVLDYAVKCAELVDGLGGDADDGASGLLFTSLVPQLVKMQRMEETSAWRRPVDVAAIVAETGADLPRELFEEPSISPLDDEDRLVEILLGEDPARSVTQLVRELRAGTSPVDLAEAVVSAAVRRVLHFGTANETPDWDTVHHTLVYASAVAEGLRRAPSPELFRGVLDGATSVYLDRFLNVPPARLPSTGPKETRTPERILSDLTGLYDSRASVEDATRGAWDFLRAGGDPDRLLAALGHVVLREDSGFHGFQQLELARRALHRRRGTPAADLALTACARWLAAQYPTRRAREQTFAIARRLHRGDPVHEG